MNLWIRSQNKYNLLLCNNFYLKCIKDSNSIKYRITNSDNVILGEYNTEKRALEILDKIQDLLMLKTEIGETYIYELPKE